MPPERCALFSTLRLHDPDFREFVQANGGWWLETRDIEAHHIFGGTSRKNFKTNVIRLAQVTHRFFHLFKQAEGRIACLWKQKQLGILDWAKLDECRGNSARGWVEVQKVSGVYAVMQRELLEWNRNLTGEGNAPKATDGTVSETPLRERPETPQQSVQIPSRKPPRPSGSNSPTRRPSTATGDTTAE